VNRALRRISTGLVAWTAGAAASVAVSMLALNVIGGAGGDAQPPTPQPAMETGQVDATSAAAPLLSTAGGTPLPTPAPASAYPGGVAASGPSAGRSATAGLQRQLSTLAGVVTAQCTGQLAYLVSWSPAPGYRVDTVTRGPASVVQVWFASPSRRQAMAVRCVAGVPRLVEPDDDLGR
jgi:hypothetical protein